MKTIVNYDVLEKIAHLNDREDFSYVDFSSDTCCDYVDSLVEDENGRQGVIVFVEPSGNITKWAATWDDALNWWEQVFKTQPSDMDYCQAGWHLANIADRLPDDPIGIWQMK